MLKEPSALVEISSERDIPMSVEETLTVCHQVASALEAAHDSGVIHRDLKPANIRITPDGKVKVLDFGLAKAVEGGSSGSDPSNSRTLTRQMTSAGVVLGTAAYMSPEQARGKPLDRRTDVWSFGCVLYECLSGKQAFRGETISDTVAAILQIEPDWSALPPHTPPRIRELLGKIVSNGFPAGGGRRSTHVGLSRITKGKSTVIVISVSAPMRRTPVNRRRLKKPYAMSSASAARAIGNHRAIGIKGSNAKRFIVNCERLSIRSLQSKCTRHNRQAARPKTRRVFVPTRWRIDSRRCDLRPNGFEARPGADFPDYFHRSA